MVTGFHLNVYGNFYSFIFIAANVLYLERFAAYGIIASVDMNARITNILIVGSRQGF